MRFDVYNSFGLSGEQLEDVVGSQDEKRKGSGADLTVFLETAGKEQKLAAAWGSNRMLVADAPPTITLKRKSGGKGAKHVPVAESGHKIAGGKGAGNRQAEIFASLMKNAARGGEKKNSGPGPVGGLRRAAEMDSLRERAIAEYRKMKGRPMNNGRSADLATDPSRLFTAVGGANVRRDAGR